MLISVIARGETFTFDSPYEDDEAISILRGFIARRRVMSSFADDLLQRIENGKRLSRKQLDWVHKFVADAERRSRSQHPKEITGQTRKPGSHRWTPSGLYD